MLCYPVCAFLILLKEVLHNPYGDEAASDVAHMLTFIQHLEDWRRKEGYEIQKVITGCSRLLAVASFATTCPRSTTPPSEMNMNAGVLAPLAQFEVSDVTIPDPYQQGLIEYHLRLFATVSVTLPTSCTLHRA